jgi:transposase-like protein
MTPSSPSAPKRSAPVLCEPCAGIQRHWRKAPGHAQASFTRYRCDRCGAAWEYENNKANQHAGWALLDH